MKRVILFFVLSFVASVALPDKKIPDPWIKENLGSDPKNTTNVPTLVIGDKELVWTNLQNRIIEDKVNKVIYWGFKDDEKKVILYPDIQAYEVNKYRRNKLNLLFSANKNIFIQRYVDRNDKVTQPESHCKSGFMVSSTTGMPYSLSYISIVKDSLPIKLHYNNDTITLKSFCKDDSAACAEVRKFAKAYQKVPKCQCDTITADELQQKLISLINGFKREEIDYWTFEHRYFINNDTVCVDKNGEICITESILENVKNAKKAILRYEIYCKHDYFTHTITGEIAKIDIKEEGFWSNIWACSFCKVVTAIAFVLILAFLLIRRKKKNASGNAQKPKNGFFRRILVFLGIADKPTTDDEQNKEQNELLAQKDEEIQKSRARIEEIIDKGGDDGGAPAPSHYLDEINKLKEQLAQKDEEIQKMKARIEELIDKGDHGGGTPDPRPYWDEINKLKEQLTQKDGEIASLNAGIKEYEKKNKELQELLTQKNDRIAILNAALGEKNKRFEELQKEKNELQMRLTEAIKKKKEVTEENAKLADKVNSLRVEIDSLKAIIADKDKQIVLYMQQINKLEEQLSKISRQNMFLLQIDDVLKDVSSGIMDAFENVVDEELKKKLVHPLMNGVSGLDMGLPTYYKRWQEQVMDVQDEFFGKSLYEMTDNEVKTKLVSGFLKNLAQGDTFSKLARLYMYIQADWINEILIKKGFEVDMIEHIFCRLKMLFNDFGIEIIYPRLFVDKMDDSLYIFDPRCDVFSIFPISEEMRILYSRQSDLIVDVIQVGVRIKSANYNRKAIVSIPNF